MTLYGRFKRLNIDFSAVGLEQRPGGSDYFCTPVGARLIGWTGCDGVHYCFVKDFGEMVFSVSPMNLPGEYVHPVAKDFADFLRLLLACGSEAAIEQVYGWDEATFDAFVQENRPDERQAAALRKIAAHFSLTPMEHPYAYMKELQAAFDYSRLRFGPDYEEWVPVEKPKPWAVYYDGHTGRKRPGTEIPVGKAFSWGGYQWIVPAVYACADGLVVDFCRKISPEQVQSFHEKYDLDTNQTRERQEELERENPLNFEFTGTAVCNGKPMRWQGMTCSYWLTKSCRGEGEAEEPEAAAAAAHYGLDPAFCWAFSRMSFPWAAKRKPAVKSLSLTLSQEPVSLPGPHFSLQPGESIAFTHPLTGVRHTLTVQEWERQEMDMSRPFQEEMDFPPHFVTMTYTLSPDIPGNRFTVQDCARSDQARPKNPDPRGPVGAGCSVMVPVARIGGADGPTAILFHTPGETDPGLHAVCSSTHFAPVDAVEWRSVFREKLLPDVTVKLLQ